MTNARYRPREFLKYPKSFGVHVDTEFVEPSSLNETAVVAASKLQHGYAIQIRKRAIERGIGLADYAVRAGMSYDRLTKLLRGEIVMRLEDIAMAELLLGGITEP